MPRRIVFRSLLTPLVAAVVVLGPPLGAGCGSHEAGLAVTVRAAPLPSAARSFTTDRGYQVTLARAHLALAGAELTSCPQARQLPGRVGLAWAHSTASATKLPESFVLGLAEAGAAPLDLGTLGPPPGRYCGLRAALTPADADALGLPDADLVGLSVRMEGTYNQEGQPAAPLAVRGALAADATAPLALTLGAGGSSTVTLTLRLEVGRWFDGLDLATATSDEVARSVLAAVSGSLVVDAL